MSNGELILHKENTSEKQINMERVSLSQWWSN